ncbi:GTPase [Compostibacillus humi]|uniref:GTPase n=1 Tax=Compostibacillus humi TaxID=1245525 RepID=A0A8J2ZR42_9BACI|nr:GTPase [Compostibacillus humi]GGH70638.1 GTPase [Compostibacillus humi]
MLQNSNQHKDFSFQDILNQMEEDYQSMMKPNIMVAGKTGVGKSTLINAIFRENLVKTGVGMPVTQHLKKISKETVPVNLFDTKGLELEDIARDEVRNEIMAEVERRAASNDASDHIHLMWYCVNYESNRLEQAEMEWIRLFAKKMPVILVLTQCITDDDTFYKELEKMNLPVVNIVRLLAAPKKIMNNFEVPAYGLKDLVQVTFQVLPEATKRAFVNAQKTDIALKVEEAKKWAVGFIASSFGVGFTPIPFSDAVALSGIQVTLIAKITNIFGFPHSQALIQTIVSAIAGSSAATLVGRAIVGNLLKIIPGVGTVAGGLINGTVASAITTSLAFAYIKVCEKLSKVDGLEEMSHEKIAKMVKEQYEKELKKKRKNIAL